jgi:hypothetical protein
MIDFARGAYIEGDVNAAPSDTVQSRKSLGRIVETVDVARALGLSGFVNLVWPLLII